MVRSFDSNTTITTGQLLERVGRRWDLLSKLEKQPSSVGEAATALGYSMADASTHLKELKALELVELESGGNDKRRRVYRLSARGRNILDMAHEFELNQSKKSSNQPKLDAWKIDLVLKALDANLTNEEMRYQLSETFFSMVPMGLWGDKRVRQIFLDIIDNPQKYDDKIGRRFRDSLQNAIGPMLEDPSGREWVLAKIYPRVEQSVRDKGLNDLNRQYCLYLLQVICRAVKEKRQVVANVAKSICLDEDVKADGPLYSLSKQILLDYLKQDPSRKDDIFDWVFKAGNSNDASTRKKAVDMLNSLTMNIIFA